MCIYLATVVISSTGGANQRHGGDLGQYEYLEDKGYYVQSSTEQSNAMFEAVYLFRDEDENWYVSTTPGKKVGYDNTGLKWQ